MRRIVPALVAAVLVIACHEPAVAPAKDGTPTITTAAGTEELCKEHGVLEAVCTKCNPALIPVFQAKGDWCAEHGFPESFCPICNPDRSGRPAADVQGEDAPADGTKVRFKTRETASLAGLEFAEAVERASRGSEMIATARILYDATKRAEVSARAAGVVRSVAADAGTPVRRGAQLAEIESAELGAERSRLHAARSREQVAAARVQREQALFEQRIAPEKDVMDARQELAAAQAELAGIQAKLEMVGPAGEGSLYVLAAPISGVVTERTATVGRMVDTSQVLFEIVDTSTMWAELDIPESDVARVAVGQPVTLAIEVLGDRQLSGKLAYISPQIDAHTRTAKARIALANPDGALRGNMFARAHIGTTSTATSVMVPRDAVQRARSASLVFVRLAEDTFEARRVRVGSEDAGWVEVSGRLAPGERVVTTGSFLLKTETLKESIGAGCCEVEE